MSNSLKTKSRTKLYDAIGGAKEITGAAGIPGNWTIQFPNLAAAGDTVTIGSTVFQFVADGSEDTAGDSAGTAADPHLITIGGTPTADTAASALATAILAETATTGKWGYLFPINATGASATTDTVTINFWPGTFPNSATYIVASASGTDPTETKVTDGVSAHSLDTNVYFNIIDTTGSTTNKEYYSMVDGSAVGQAARLIVTSNETGDTPTVLGHFSEFGVAMVECELITAEPGQTAEFLWTGSAWELTNHNRTIPDFTAA